MKNFRPRKIPGIALAVLFSLLSGASTEANGPPPQSETAFVVGLQGAAFRSFVDTRKKSAPGRDLRVFAVPLIFPYEVLPNRLVLAGAIPYLDKELEVQTPGGRQTLGDSGFGDLALTAKVQVLQRDRPQGTTRLTLLGRVKLPTGKNDARAPDGSLLPPSLQLGTGSVDYSGGAIVTALKQRWGINGDLIYRANTSDNGFRFGDSLRYDAALAFRAYPRDYESYPSPQLNLFLEANGSSQEKNQLSGTSLPDSGGTTVFLSPGIQYMAGRTFLVEASFQLPVVENLNGDQLETDYTFRLGIRWLLF